MRHSRQYNSFLSVSQPGQRRTVRNCPAAVVLLEVVLSLALFASSVAVVSGVVSHCQLAVERIRIRTMLSDLAISRLSELHVGLLAAEVVQDMEFEDPLLADYSWSLYIDPQDDLAEELQPYSLVTVTVRHNSTGLTRRLSEQLYP